MIKITSKNRSVGYEIGFRFSGPKFTAHSKWNSPSYELHCLYLLVKNEFL